MAIGHLNNGTPDLVTNGNSAASTPDTTASAIVPMPEPGSTAPMLAGPTALFGPTGHRRA